MRQSEAAPSVCLSACPSQDLFVLTFGDVFTAHLTPKITHAACAWGARRCCFQEAGVSMETRQAEKKRISAWNRSALRNKADADQRPHLHAACGKQQPPWPWAAGGKPAPRWLWSRRNTPRPLPRHVHRLEKQDLKSKSLDHFYRLPLFGTVGFTLPVCKVRKSQRKLSVAHRFKWVFKAT